MAVTAYLEAIPPAVRRLAAARADADHWRVALTWASLGAAFGLLQASGALVRARDGLAARVGHDGWVSLLAPLLFAFALQAARLFASSVAAALRPGGGGFEADLIGAMAGLPAGTLIGGLGAWLLLRALDRWPRWGWAGLSGLAGIVIVGAVVVAPVTLPPMLRGDRPVAASGGNVSAMLDFVRRGGLDASRLYAFDAGDAFAVDMEGLGPLTHAAVGRAALASPRPETYAAIGHLLGHHRHGDLWVLAVLWTGLAAVFFYAAWTVCGRLARRWDRSAAPSAADAARLPVIGLIGWASMLAAVPVFNLFDQAINYRADDYAMTLTGDPDALCRWLIAAEGSSKADPSPLEALLFYDHPPLKARLENALRWKAEHAARQDAGL